MPQQGKNVLVIFDLVSTLTDAGPRYARAFEEVCNDNGIPAPSEEELLAMLGNKNLSEITDKFAGPMSAEKKEAFMASCNQACDAMLYRPEWHETLYPHVREAVEDMRKCGVTLGVFTGTREDAMENQLAYHQLSAAFASSYRRGKDNIRDIGKSHDALKAEQLGSIVEQFKKDIGNDDICVIVVGDSVTDARAAEKMGLFFIGFAINQTKKNHLEKAGVTAIVPDFSDLPDLVSRFCPSVAHDPVVRRPTSPGF